MKDSVVVVAAARTPMGGFQGVFSGLSAPQLGAVAIGGALERAKLGPDAVDQVMMGCVLAAALGQAPARQAGLLAGLPVSAPAVTINKMCGSGMQAAIMAHDALAAGSADVIVAGGMESMTNAPYALAKHRAGARIGHDRIVDTMMMDGLEDAYDRGKPMGAFAELVAQEHQFTRQEMDAYAIESLRRANSAIETGAFSAEIVPVTVASRSGEESISIDEQPGKARPEKIPSLRPAFADGGTITAASSASISDGASALLLSRSNHVERLGLEPVARIVAHATHAQRPEQFVSAPIGAIDKVLQRAGWALSDVDLFEINEAFAVVAMLAARELNIDHERLNVNGGACALGHPIGASGTRIVTTLIAALERRKLRRGLAALCIGGGEATALAIELI